MTLVLLAVYLFFLPFQWALVPFSGTDLALARPLTLLLFFFWIAESLRKKTLLLPKPFPLFLLLGFLFLSAFSLFWAENQSWAVRKVIFLFNFIPLFFVFFSVLREQEARTSLFKAFFGGAFLAACLSIIQFLLQFPFGVERIFSFWTETLLPFFLGPSFGEVVGSYPSLLVNVSGVTLLRASAFFPDPHIAAFYFGMALPLACLFSLRETGKRKILFLGAALIILLADLLTFSRGGYAALLGSIFSVILLFPRFSKKALSPFFLSLALPVLLVFFLSPLGNRLFSSFSIEDGSNAERIRLFHEAISFLEKNPLLGTGIGNYPLLVRPDASFREPIYVHNLFLDLSVEIGFLGALLFFGLIIFALFKNYALWKKDGDLERLALFASLTLFFFHVLFEAPLFSVHVFPILLLLLAGSISEAPFKKSVSSL